MHHLSKVCKFKFGKRKFLSPREIVQEIQLELRLDALEAFKSENSLFYSMT